MIQYFIYAHIDLLLVMALLIAKLLLVVNISSDTGEKVQSHKVRRWRSTPSHWSSQGVVETQAPSPALTCYLVAYELGTEIFLIIDFHWLLIYKG